MYNRRKRPGRTGGQIYGAESRIISDADMLCWILLNEMAEDTIQAGGSEHAVFEAEPEELKQIRKTLQPYMNQLPEYTYLYEKLFKVI